MNSSSAQLDPQEPALHAVVAALRERCGIEVPQYQLKVLRPLVQRLGGTSGVEGGTERLLARDVTAWNEVIEAITIPETYFFRHYPHFVELAALASDRFRNGRPCHVLSAGCSSGEEAWSIAAVLDSCSRGTGGRGGVVGWDINGARLSDAAAGEYRDWSVRSGLHDYPSTLSRAGDTWKVSRHLEPWVRFEVVNLIAQLPKPATKFDAIFFRNVAIYWKPSLAREVASRLSDLLADDGLFLVGPCDPVSLPSDAWEHAIHDGVRTYRRATGRPKRRTETPERRDSIRAATFAPPQRVRRAHASARAQASASPPPRARVTPLPARRSIVPPLATKVATPDPLAEVKLLADRGEYRAALALLGRNRLATVEACMWEGILRLNLDEPRAAVTCFRRCVYLDPERVAFRKWLAVAFEAAGMREEAERERRNALDPRMR